MFSFHILFLNQVKCFETSCFSGVTQNKESVWLFLQTTARPQPLKPPTISPTIIFSLFKWLYPPNTTYFTLWNFQIFRPIRCQALKLWHGTLCRNVNSRLLQRLISPHPSNKEFTAVFWAWPQLTTPINLTSLLTLFCTTLIRTYTSITSSIQRYPLIFMWGAFYEICFVCSFLYRIYYSLEFNWISSKFIFSILYWSFFFISLFFYLFQLMRLNCYTFSVFFSSKI